MESRRIFPFSLSYTLAALAFVLSMPANANLISNGSFEAPTPLSPCNPSICSGSFLNFNAGSSFDSWLVVGAGQMSLGSGDLTQLGFTFPAQDGQQWADLSGFGDNDPVGIQQVISTVAGDFYDLSFWVGNTVDTALGLFGTTSTVEVLLNGMSLGLFTNTDGNTTTDWQQFSLIFQATGATSSIAFFNRDLPDDNMNGLDNIVVTERATTVPEPGTLALLSLGLLLTGQFSRTRRGRRCTR